MKKVLGLDVGVASVGWAVIDEDDNIIRTGVRLFEEAVAKNNLERRGFRGQRRLVRRRGQRIIDMRKLLILNKLIDDNFKPLSNPYELRLKGLEETLSKEELSTVLLQYAKRRGSSLEVVEDDKIKSEESTKAILNINEKELKKNDFIIKVQLERLSNDGKIRGTYNNFKSKDYEKELTTILKNQNIEDALKEQIIALVKRRRHFSEGPGNYHSPSPYGRYREVSKELKKELVNIIQKKYKDKYLKEAFDMTYNNMTYHVFKNGTIINKDKYDLIDLMRGKCSIYPDLARAPKMAFSAELFNFLNDLNNLKIMNRENVKITLEEKEAAINLIKEKGSITVNQLLKILNTDIENIKGFRIDKNEKPLITEFKGYKKILKVYKDLGLNIEDYIKIDKIVEVLTQTIVEEERVAALKKLDLEEILVSRLSVITGIKEYHSLSFKAIYQLNDEMLHTTLNQQEIITLNKLKQDKENNKLLLDESLILSPVAKRAHKEALKLVSELIKEEGKFERIIIETTREKNSSEEIKQIKELQKINEKNKKYAQEAIGDRAPELIKQSNILKVRLYDEQEGKCAYTNKPLDLDALLNDPGIYEIDHIIPISISYDDSFNNKVLVTHAANQKKKNMTPFGYFTKGDLVSDAKIKNWDEFKEIILSNKKYSIRKKQNLLFAEDITKNSVIRDFVNRNLVDTSYAVRSLMTTLKGYFASNNIDTKVMTIKGKQTNLLRKTGYIAWKRKHPNLDNIFYKDRDVYKHHAVDALIIAGLSNKKYINQLYRLSNDVDNETGEIIEYVNATEDSQLIQYLLKIAQLKASDFNYSWKIDSKPNRTVANQLMRSAKIINNERILISKINIYEATRNDLENKIFNNKENVLMYKNDIKTFEKLERSYLQYKHEAYPFKAYKEEQKDYVRKYSKQSSGAPVINVKYMDTVIKSEIIDLSHKYDVDKTKKVVYQTSIKPFRVDVYYNGEEYKVITITYKDVKKNSKKNVVQNYDQKKISKKIGDDYKFVFSLYKNTILKIDNSEFYRFIGIVDSQNRFELKPVSCFPTKVNSNGVKEADRKRPAIDKKIKNITKYNVSITGKISKVDKEELKLVW